MDELVKDIRSQLINLVDNHSVSMLSISKDTGIAYQTVRRLVLDTDSNPTASSIRKFETYLKGKKGVA